MGYAQPETRPETPAVNPQRAPAGHRPHLPPEQARSQGISLEGLAKSLGLEGDRLIIMLLVVLLMNEHADPRLILALLWIAI